jgi:hypothetical protein
MRQSVDWNAQTDRLIRRAKRGWIDTSDLVEKLESLVQDVPLHHSNHEDKIFCLPGKTHSFGVVHAGQLQIGRRSIKLVISDFAETSLEKLLTSNWTLETVGSALKDYLEGLCVEHAGDRPISLMLMLCGFQPDTDDGLPQPAVAQMSIRREKDSDEIETSLVMHTPPGLAFGGRTDEIEKLTEGMTRATDEELWNGFYDHQEDIINVANGYLREQYDRLERHRQRNLPRARKVKRDFLDIEDFDTPLAEDLADPRGARFNYLNMNEQTAINFVDFLINLQIKVDEFSQRPPTVGGDIQLALIQKQGFTWISQREWRHGPNSVKRDD